MGVVFDGSDLTGVAFSGAHLIQRRLMDPVLGNANLISVDFSDAILVDCDLMGANLYRASFKGATLINVDLSTSNLVDADLDDVSLINTNIQHADR